MAPLLVSTEWLATQLDNPAVRVVDVRWYLFDKTKTGHGEYLHGHIPGAVYLDIDHDLAAPFGTGPGRHPLPRAEVFQEAMQLAGVDHDTHVFAYDDMGGASAARLWWLLNYFGHAQASLLDGGLLRWVNEGRPLESGSEQVARGNWTAGPPRRAWVADKEMVERLAKDPSGLVLDARMGERYRGETEPIDPRAGHVPGAVSAPYPGNWRGPDDQRFLDKAQLRTRFEALGAGRATDVVAYCGSGVNACQEILALRLAGFDNVLLYEGSWSDWSRDPDRPAATGPNP